MIPRAGPASSNPFGYAEIQLSAHREDVYKRQDQFGAALHTARELRGVLAAEILEADHFQQLHGRVFEVLALSLIHIWYGCPQTSSAW